jgi:hypothetical protein
VFVTPPSLLHAIKEDTMLTALIVFRNYQKMSSSMFNEIPKLSSSADYPRWSQTIQAYLRVQKVLKVITKSPPTLVLATSTTPSNQDAVDAWEELEGIA